MSKCSRNHGRSLNGFTSDSGLPGNSASTMISSHIRSLIRFWAMTGLCAVCLLLAESGFASCCRADNHGQVPRQLRAGAAASNITPPLGGGIVGGFVPIPSTHVHDDLFAKCLVLDDGQTKLAFVVCDLLGMHRAVGDEARRLIEERLQIPRSNIMISTTHTHSACSALGSSRYKFEIELDEYQKFVAQRIADGVQRATQLLRPAELAFGTADAPEHVFNRRWFMADGTVPENPFGQFDKVKMNPPAGSPDLKNPAGPTDPTIYFLAVREPQGPPISLFAAYSLHYVGGVGDGHISADYFGEFCRQLVRLQDVRDQDPPYVPMLANGTSGDINNINFRSPRPGKKPYEQIRIVAHDVADRVHKALADVKWRSDLSLAATFRDAEIGWRRPTEQQLAWANAKLQTPPASNGRADLPRIYAERTLGLATQPERAPVPIQVLRVGDVCIGTLPCEVFCEIGLEFRENSPQKPAFMVSLAHGYFGYLPTPEQHVLGGYETWLGTNRMEPDASDILLKQLWEMADEVRATDGQPSAARQ